MANNVKLGQTGGISVIDFGAFLDGSKKQAVADAMIASFKSIGFVYLVNHGLPQDKIRGMFEWASSRRFFALPMEKKMLAPHPTSGTHHRGYSFPITTLKDAEHVGLGYSAPGVEKVTQHVYEENEIAKQRAKAPDVKESFESGREDDAGMPNIWPPEDVLPGFREACLGFYWVGVYCVIVPVQKLRDEEVIRIGAHSDFGSITLLLQDEVGGLEVEDPNRPGEFIVGLNNLPSCRRPSRDQIYRVRPQ
ncbi:hypothetical protein EIP86_002676 [Pleurotus ostreatoroseus]|nr:hypothetical protein EIP86_002676 [Pleurotus ostreatoroseus]